MHEFSRPLGDTVKRARGKLNMTQSEVAASANIDVRTVLNIENYKGNPKLEVLYPLIRKLNIDPNELFYPEIQRNSPALDQLRLLVDQCDEDEAETLFPIVKSVLSALRTLDGIHIK